MRARGGARLRSSGRARRVHFRGRACPRVSRRRVPVATRTLPRAAAPPQGSAFRATVPGRPRPPTRTRARPRQWRSTAVSGARPVTGAPGGWWGARCRCRRFPPPPRRATHTHTHPATRRARPGAVQTCCRSRSSSTSCAARTPARGWRRCKSCTPSVRRACWLCHARGGRAGTHGCIPVLAAAVACFPLASHHSPHARGCCSRCSGPRAHARRAGALCRRVRG